MLKCKCQRGFTFVELLVVTTILLILASAVLPRAKVSIQRQRDAELRRNVREMRTKKGAAGAPAEAGATPKAKREPKPDEFAGKKIYLVGKDNPRREGTHGHRSMEVVKNKPGITFEDYISGGGRRVDLKGSIELKQVELK